MKNASISRITDKLNYTCSFLMFLFLLFLDNFWVFVIIMKLDCFLLLIVSQYKDRVLETLESVNLIWQQTLFSTYPS